MHKVQPRGVSIKATLFSISLFLLLFGILPPFPQAAELEIDPEPLNQNPPRALAAEDVLLPDLTGIVTNTEAAKALGKALFWDMRLGSDNLACASCHFHAGADNRSKNQLSPGLLQVANPSRIGNPDTSFGNASGKTGAGKTAGANYSLTPRDFPFHRLQNMDDRNSPVVCDTNDVTSSQGSFGGFLLSEDPDPAIARFPDFCGGNDTTFTVDGIPVRKVEPRNTPTTINAVFNHRNFWDGRANNIFNGVNPFGPRDRNARVVVLTNGSLGLERLGLANASLASQAVGPPLSAFEMACSGRDFKDLGRGMFALRALALQAVHPTDSLLGNASSYRNETGLGLNKTYMELIQLAFNVKYWGDNTTKFEIADKGNGPVINTDVDPAVGYTQAEHNFSMFFGISIMLYEATLVSNQTAYDTFITANPTLINNGAGTIVEQGDTVTTVPGFGQKELLGLDVFLNKGRCYECHFGPEFTSASIRVRGTFPNGELEVPEPVEVMAGPDARAVVYDGGFYNIGARPTTEDLGVGGQDPFGNTLSFSRQLTAGDIIDPNLSLPFPNFYENARVGVDGAFKTPSVRNAELTGPYMHNGGLSTLRQVVEFYDRGGDRRDVTGVDGCFGVIDTSGFGNAGDGSHCTNLAPPILPLNLTEAEIDALVAFILALTDERVKYEKAPFDHPELIIPNGQEGDQFSVTTVTVNPEDPSGGETLVRAKDMFRVLPAIGAAGRQAENLPALGPFLNLDPFSLGLPGTAVPQIVPLLLEN